MKDLPTSPPGNSLGEHTFLLLQLENGHAQPTTTRESSASIKIMDKMTARPPMVSHVWLQESYILQV